MVRAPLVLATILGGLAGLWFLTSASKTSPPGAGADRATLAWEKRPGARQWQRDREAMTREIHRVVLIPLLVLPRRS